MTTISIQTAPAPTPASDLSLHGVEFRYGPRAAGLGPLDLTVRPGEFLTVVGPSGSGKSTLLALLAGFLRPSRGEIRLGGEVLRGPGVTRTLMQQEAALFPWRTVLANVRFGLERAGLPRAEQTARAQAALDLVNLGEFRDRRAHELSGGQRQRVALARALAVRPPVLLLDEPFSALDVATRHELGAELRRVWREQGMTVVFVTHQLEEALRLGERVVALRDGQVALDRRTDEIDQADLAAALTGPH